MKAKEIKEIEKDLKGNGGCIFWVQAIFIGKDEEKKEEEEE